MIRAPTTGRNADGDGRPVGAVPELAKLPAMTVIRFLLPLALTAVLAASSGHAAPKEVSLSRNAQTEAQFNMGVRAYDAGDYKTAYQTWLPLARKGDLAAQRNVAHLLRRGLGVPKNPKRAFRLYRRAAESGLSSAQVNLAFLYRTGEGTKRNQREAVYWFLRAARAGQSEAQFQLGRMLETGNGLKRNLTKAVIYYLAAASQGHLEARYRLGALRAVARGMDRLTPISEPDTGVTGTPAIPRPSNALYGGTQSFPQLVNAPPSSENR